MSERRFPSEPGTFLGDLRAELVEAARRYDDGSDKHRRRQGGRLAPLAAVGLAAILLIMFIALDSGDSVGAKVLTFTPLDGAIRVELVDLTANSAQVTEELRSAGLNIEVVDVPVSVALVGLFVSAGSTEAFEFIEYGAGGQIAFLFPAGYAGAAQLNFGRAARPGEPYLEAASEFLARGRFECSELLGADAGDAIAELEADGFEIFRIHLRDSEGLIREQSIPSLDGLLLVEAVGLDDTQLFLTVSADPTPVDPRVVTCS